MFARYLGIALASAFELDYFLQAASDARVWAGEEAGALTAEVTEIRRMLYVLRRRVVNDPRGVKRTAAR